jgi:SAM-dependent methyltransferase
MSQVLETVSFEPGATILDLGSNTCWATAMLAQHGLEPTALDISLHEMQGLRTGDWQMEAKDVFFERVLGVMYDLPFADASFDHIWACEVLHHNHRAELAQTFAECFRVLRPGGSLIVGNEPLRTVRTPKLRPGHEVKDFEGNEHAYMRFTYTRMAERAGFEVDVRGPWLHGLFRPGGIGLSERLSDGQILSAAAGALVRRRPRLVRAALASRAYVRGGTSLHMICTKS